MDSQLASTGNSSAIHNIYSWNFSSILEIDDNITIIKDPVSSPNIPAPNQRKNNALGLAMGLGSGGFFWLAGWHWFFLPCGKEVGGIKKKIMSLITVLVKNLKGVEDLGSFHTMN